MLMHDIPYRELSYILFKYSKYEASLRVLNMYLYIHFYNQFFFTWEKIGRWTILPKASVS
jgi:hypothetical protein